MCHAILTRVERIRYLMSAGVPGGVALATVSCVASIPLSSMQSVDATHTMKLRHTTGRFQMCRTNSVSNESLGVHSRSRPSGGERPHSGGQANIETSRCAVRSKAAACVAGPLEARAVSATGWSVIPQPRSRRRIVALDAGAAILPEVTA